MTEEKGVAVTTTKEIAFNGEVRIGMSEMVSVGVARMERQFKVTIKTLREDVKTLNKDIEAKICAASKISETLVPDNVAAASKKLQAAFDLIEGIKDVKIDYSAKIYRDTGQVEYLLTIDKKNSYGSNAISLISGKIPISKEMKDLYKESDHVAKIIKEKQTKIMELTRKMSDVSFLERQLKARIVEDQLNKSEDGRALLNSAVSKFEEDMDLLG